ncbi:MAG TPA: hypothetical protein VH206_14980 [Xanthobacteraceae bacterium]|jgi:hypothetical protein|nr:hypothetical protein [Xanthobacteraceae bacterium]
MRKLLFAGVLVCLSASGAMAQIRNCTPIKAIKARMACIEANQAELDATLAALMNGVQIKAQVGGDMAFGNPWCLMIKSGANATVAKNCVVLPGEFATTRWQLVPVH